jgi:methionine aminotransferase
MDPFTLQLPKSRLPEVGTNIFSIMTALAQKHGAINLAQGFPDFPPDEDLIAYAMEALQGNGNQYAPMSGYPDLKHQIAQLTESLYGHKPDPETEITITSGATEAITDAILALTSPGDEVILLEPCYDSYIPAIRLAGAIPIPVALNTDDYSVNWEAVQQSITAKTRFIIINSPHNPTGAAWTIKDIHKLRELVKHTHVLILSDEVYEHICFLPEGHQSILKYPDLAERAIVVSSFGKTFHVTGWKVGYCIAPLNLTMEFRKVHQFVTFSTAHPLQQALAKKLQHQSNIQSLSGDFCHKRDFFLDQMKNSKFRPLPCNGTYFQLMSYADIPQFAEFPDTQVANILTEEFGVATIPVSVFYNSPIDNKVLRFCFAKKEETLERAAQRLCKI